METYCNIKNLKKSSKNYGDIVIKFFGKCCPLSLKALIAFSLSKGSKHTLVRINEMYCILIKKNKTKQSCKNYGDILQFFKKTKQLLNVNVDALLENKFYAFSIELNAHKTFSYDF